MIPATREDILEVFGELDDLVVAEIEKLIPTPSELRLAREWIFSSSIERREVAPSPKVARIASLLRDELAAEHEDVE